MNGFSEYGILSVCSQTLFLMVLLSSAASCVRRPLDYERIDYAAITVILDWSKAGIDPNGATILFYPEDGSSCIKKLSPGDTVTLNISKGIYTILAFNDTDEDLYGLGFRGMEGLGTAEAFLKETMTRKSNDKTVYAEPEILASAIKQGFAVTAELIEKTRSLSTRTRSVSSFYDADLTVVLQPERVTHTVTVTVYLNGMSGLSSSGAYMDGFSSSAFLADGRYSDRGITQMVTFAEKVITDESTSSGYLRGSFNCLGPKGGFGISPDGYTADYRAAMQDGTLFEKSVTLNQSEISFEKGLWGLEVNISIASAESPIELPKVENGEGGWQVSVGEWEDINVPIDF